MVESDGSHQCNGNKTTTTEPCTPSVSSPFTESNRSIAKGHLVLKNLTIDGAKITNEDLQHIIDEKGKVFEKIKNSSAISLLSFYRKSNPDVEQVIVTNLSVGSLVIEYIIILKGHNQTVSDLNVFPNTTVNIFPDDSIFAAETSAQFSSITGALLSSNYTKWFENVFLIGNSKSSGGSRALSLPTFTIESE